MLGIASNDGGEYSGASMNYFGTINKEDQSIGETRRRQASRVFYYEWRVQQKLNAGTDFQNILRVEELLWRQYFKEVTWAVFRCNKGINDEHPHHWEPRCRS
jgi:hypothetical protein